MAALTLVTCNPPYKKAEHGILSSSDSDIIARHETMCSIDDVCAAAAKLLQFGGRLCICQRPERLLDVLEAMRRHKIEPKAGAICAKARGHRSLAVFGGGTQGRQPLFEGGSAAA